eukprot:XP_001698151.1 predicted protein [Chlamydomonas reinhardtii]
MRPHLLRLLDAAAHQQDATASGLAKLFAKFVAQLPLPCGSGELSAASDASPLPVIWADLAPNDGTSLAATADYLTSDQVTWFADFGCAVLATGALGHGGDAGEVQAARGQDLRPRPDHVSLHVVAPECWRFEAHSSPGGSVQHTAKPAAGPDTAPTVWSCGNTIPTSDLPRVLGIMHELITKSRNAKAKDGRKGFQRTPAFIVEVAGLALQRLWEQEQDGGGGGGGAGVASKLPQPRGGTTDVGQHTGHDTVRNTCWPLVRAVVQVSLQSTGVCGPQQLPDLLFRRAMAHMDLWLLRRQVQCLSSPAAAATPIALTAAMHMLHATAAKAANLAAEGEDVSAFVSDCDKSRSEVEGVAAERACQAAEQHSLPDAGSSDALGVMQLPAGVLPGLPPAQRTAGGLEAALQRAQANLGSVPLLEPGASLVDMQGMLESALWSKPAGDATAQLVLRSVERELFTRAAALQVSSSRRQLSDATLEVLEAVVDTYRNALHAFMQTPAAQSAMQPELRSREVLVVWCAYCLAHDSVARRHPMVRGYRPALQFEDLRHLVLSDRPAVDAVLAVAAYLNQQQQCGGPPLFSLRDGGSGTFGFAERFAGQDSQLQQILASERADATARVDAHWANVQQQKRELAKARQDLASLQATEQSLRTQLSRAGYCSSEYNKLISRINSNSSAQSGCKSRISSLEKPPAPVLQPLPAADSLARRFLGQQVLLPRPLDGRSPQLAAVYAVVSVQLPPTSVVAYYNERRALRTYIARPTQAFDGKDGAVMLYASGEPPQKVGPTSIDHYNSPADGVWYPDSLEPHLFWSGTGSAADSGCGFPTYFNPFACVDVTTVEEFFTERLPGKAAALQWAAHQHTTVEATPRDRGNWALASQESCPTELLSKSEFLQFGRMRSYPLQQLRNLCEVLRRQDQALPLTGPAVQLLLRQLLFHVGPIHISTAGSSSIASSRQPQLLWRMGWEQPGDVLDALCTELGALADTLDGKVRDHDAILLLGEVAAYLADWHAPCGAVARRFAVITLREADRLQAELDAAAGIAGDDRRVSELLARQVRWRVMALLCYGAGPLAPAGSSTGQQHQAEDAAVMVQLMVQICHGLTFQDNPATLRELQLLRARAHNVMALRVERLRELISGREDAVLTAAVASVLERTPASLSWYELIYPTLAQQPPAASYQAEGSDGRLYSINILDGTVLFDGCPPSRLPKEIVQHPLYVRTFGSFNFEVAFAGETGSAAGPGGGGEMVLQTLRTVRGRLYDFRLCAAAADEQLAQLVITEVDAEHGGERLELLDAGADSSCRGWGEQLPVRLRGLHSHWLSRQRGVLVLRPRSFQEHECAFLVKCLPGSGSSASSMRLPISAATPCTYDCRRVPLHLQSRHWLELLQLLVVEGQAASEAAQSALLDRLVLLRGSKVVGSILAKFEDRRFIHTFISVSNGEVSFELPRCGLEFSMRQQVPVAGAGQKQPGGHQASCCQLLSRNYTGYRLRQVQQLAERCKTGGGATGAATYTLPEFRQYLVLERIPRPSVAPVGAQRAEVLVLVPAGVVASRVWDANGDGSAAGVEALVRITLPACSSSRARLQLAALYAATSTLLPEPGSRCTGAQTAMELLRQCWSTRPLEAAEAEQLAAVGRLGGHLAPGLHLLAHDLAASAAQLAHLHAASAADNLPVSSVAPAASTAGAVGGSAAPGTGSGNTSGLDAHDRTVMPRLCADHAHAYAAHWHAAEDDLPPGWGVNPRMLLTPIEEERTLGRHLPCKGPPAWRRQRLFQPISVLGVAPAMPFTFVKELEAQLLGLMTVPKAKRKKSGGHPYPLAASHTPLRPLEADMHAELQESWEAHRSQPDLAAYGVKPECLERATATAHRRNLEAHLLRQLALVPQSVGSRGVSLRLLRAAAAAAEAGPLDLMRVAVRPELVAEFNPFLSPEAAQELQRRVLTWLQLCVLEDRLGRVEALAAAREAGDDCLPQLVQELGVHRTWDMAAHPEWLVFEVESQLQIRPQQYTVARMLMEGGDGPIAQLNMGEGKTRVILPMLVLALADGKRVVSLAFLSTLLDEADAYLHGALCAGVLGRKLFTMPFHRDIELTPARVLRMRAALAHCMQYRGVLLVAPEHRLSLELKWKELICRERQGHEATATTGGAAGCSQQVVTLLAALLRTPVLSILDESDELLHHRYQLIYACGGKTPLVGFEARTGAIRAVFDSIAVLSNSGELRLPHASRVLEPPMTSSPDEEAPSGGKADPVAAAVAAGMFCGLRLLPGPDLEAALPAFHEQLARHVLDHLPFEFQKMADVLDEEEMELVVACVTKLDEAAEEALGEELMAKLTGPGGGSDLYEFVLALRGLLGGGILRHGLTLRNQVDYGIDRRKASIASSATRTRTRMAVPYRAAHTPSERSEFAQPDVALLLTHLAYRYDGLTLPEFTAAVDRLLHGLGKEAAADHYREWVGLSAESIPQDELARFSDVNQLDASSSSQMAAMHRHLRRNTAVVDFWLRYCVLPAETRQYPQRLGASAWDLAAAGARVMGFSGTNDNYRLLPLRLHQAAPEDAALKATNGRMLDVTIKHTRGFHTLSSVEDSGGVPVWQSLLQMALDTGAHAVLDCGALMAGTSNRRAAEYLLAGPRLQRLQQLRFRGVTYFDEAARGWVVLEHTGRCLPRASSPLQEHETFVLYDEARCRGADLKLQRSAVGLLTLGPRVCKDKLMQAAGRLRQLSRGQALRFAATADIAARVVEYAAASGSAGGAAAAAAGGSTDPGAVDVLAWVMGNTVDANLHGVVQWAAQGLHFATTLGAPERSVQDEVLGLRELYASSKAPHPLQAAAAHGTLQPLSTAVDWLDSQDPTQPMDAVPWSGRVYISCNYLHAIADLPDDQPLNDYLRPVGWLLVLSGGEVVLLSEREADQLLAAAWHAAAKGAAAAGRSGATATDGPLLVSLAYAWQAVASLPRAKPPLLVTNLGLAAAGIAQDPATAWPQLRRRLGVRQLISVRVFAGETSYRVRPGIMGAAPSNGNAELKAAAQKVEAELRRLVEGRRPQVQQLLVMRGRQSQMTRSDLEKAVEGLQLQL